MNIIRQYEILQNEEQIPFLKQINQFDLKDWGIDDLFEDVEDFTEEMELICEMLNIPYLEAEHLFIVARDNKEVIKGIYLLGIGSPNELSQYDKRNMVLFLALIGAVSFYTIHNHPNGQLLRSDADVFFAANMNGIGGVIGIECIGNYAVTTEGYVNIDSKETKYFNE